MLLTTTQCLSRAKWLIFRKQPQKLRDFYTVDEASRGPLGALNLIIRLGGRSYLASFGAVIVLATVAVDLHSADPKLPIEIRSYGWIRFPDRSTNEELDHS